LNKLRKERTGKAVDVDVIDGPIDDDVRRRLFAIGNETADTVYRVKLRHRVYGHDTIAILWVQQVIIFRVKWRRFVVLFKQN